MRERISAQEAAARLGVKRETLYAYVSRGLLESRTFDGKTSTFDPDEIDALRRSRHRPREGRLDTSIVSSITHVADQRVYVRGHDLVDLAAKGVGFEAVASLLWTGQLAVTADWQSDPSTVERCRSLQVCLPDGSQMIDRLRLNVIAASSADPLRHDTRASGVARAAAPLVAAMVDGLPGAASRESRLATRLWPALTSMRPTSRWIDALDAALVLLADHDLAASTFAGRIAASTHADPYSVVLAALGAFGGPLHGAASGPVYDLIEAAAAGRAGPSIATLLTEYDKVPGFGHFHYPDGDPRARALLECVHEARPARRRLQASDEVRQLTEEHTGVKPNVDFALATLAYCAGMDRHAGETIFAIARAAGWLAHAIEEYGEAPLRFRPVTRYVGP